MREILIRRIVDKNKHCGVACTPMGVDKMTFKVGLCWR